MTPQIIYRRIWLAVFDPPVHCADIAIERLSNGRISQSALRYTAEYLNRPAAFAIDPVNFPLTPGEHRLNVPFTSNLPGVISDALPDRWGRHIRYKLQGIPPGDDIAHMDLREGAGVGALLFSKPDEAAPALSFGEEWTAAPAHYKRMEGSTDIVVNIVAGSSAGGARPKLLCRDPAGEPIIVKFAAPGDEYDVVQSEFQAMRAARSVGIPAPEIKLTSVAGHTGLAVRRFDCAADGNRRWHMVSLATLLHDTVAGNWMDIARIVTQFSAEPRVDLEHLYRRMIFDAMIHNTDNHYRNFCLMHDGAGWRLAPSYDLVPQPAQGQYPFLSFDTVHWIPSDLTDLLTLRERFHLSPARARKIFDEVMSLNEGKKDWLVGNSAVRS